jgi:hypothetical protein
MDIFKQTAFDPMLAQQIFFVILYTIASAAYSSWDSAGVSPPDDSLINGWLPPASGIDILYTATHIAVRGETASEGNPVNDTRGQNENQTNDGDGMSMRLPDVAHNPEYLTPRQELDFFCAATTIAVRFISNKCIRGLI